MIRRSKNYISPRIKHVSQLILILTALYSCSNRSNTLKYSLAIAQTEMNRSPEMWMLNGSNRLYWNYYHIDEYYNYVNGYIDTMTFTDGSIFGYKVAEYSMYLINNGNLLIRLNEKENKSKYKKATELLKSQLDSQPRTKTNGFWHKKIHKNKIWLDEYYMGMVFYSKYCSLTNDTVGFNDFYNQFMLAKKYLCDNQTILYKHGCDENKTEKWANPISGQSQEVRGRGLGWLAISLVDVLDFYPENMSGRDSIKTMFTLLMTSIVKYQDPKLKVWHQIIDKGGEKGNYPESSYYSMSTYYLLKGVRKGYLSKEFFKKGISSYKGLLNQFIIKHDIGTLSISNCNKVGGLGGKPYRDGSYIYYISAPYSYDDPKSVASIIMASLEHEMRMEKLDNIY